MKLKDLLCVVELGSIVLVLELGWFHLVLQSAEISLSEFHLGVGLKTLVQGRALSLVVLGVNSRTCSLGERFTEQVLRLDLRHVTSVAGNVLSFQVLSRATKPIVALLGIVSVRNGATLLIDLRRSRVVLASGI